MALNIKDTETDRLARDLSNLTGESITQAVKHALEGALEQEKMKLGRTGVAARLKEIGERCAKLPVLDDRTAEELIGYDEDGLPT